MPYEIPLHEHGFWHLDLVRTGKITAFGEDWTRELPPGGAILLPAGCRHGFRYGSGEKTWLTRWAFPTPLRFLDSSNALRARIRVTTGNGCGDFRQILGGILVAMRPGMRPGMGEGGPPSYRFPSTAPQDVTSLGFLTFLAAPADQLFTSGRLVFHSI